MSFLLIYFAIGLVVEALLISFLRSEWLHANISPTILDKLDEVNELLEDRDGPSVRLIILLAIVWPIIVFCVASMFAEKYVFRKFKR